MSWLREPNSEPIAGYRLIEPLGSGGFGEVWKCEAPGGIHKAIKFVFGNLNSLDVDGIRAEQELHALERVRDVRHPFVCSLDRIEKVDGELVIVMELAERTLHDLYMECKAAGLIGVPRDDLLRYLRDAAEALDYMNEKHNLQHLDVKPRNLFVIAERVKVADFGLVKHLERQTATGLMGGVTPLYAPPETFNGKISERSDQYSLAIVYQELLTGQRPFAGKNVRQLAQQHMKEDPDLRSLPEAERPAVARCLEKDPAKRFPNCMAFIAALYRARHPSRVTEPEPLLVAAGTKRPKTMCETMEDIVLEGLGDLNAPISQTPRPVGVPEEIEAEDLGVTIPQPETGALRPTLIVGVGGFGRKALLELRCRFLDRFGDLSKLPLLRFVCIDADREAANLAVRGAPEVALTRSEVHCLPLQPVGNYRKRMLEQLSEWLPREKLYGMPRSLQPQGSRALARLAFADSQQRLLGRLKRDIQEVSQPDALYHSVNRTGLALRDNTPRIYVIGAAGGGCSGMLVDLGYAIRRLLQQLRHPDGRVSCFLFCGAPTDPATPKLELANTYATLTEINHYSDFNIPFAAEYGVDGQRIVDQGAPFNSVYLLPLQNRSPECLDGVISHLGSYLFHELTTPLGLRLDGLRQGGSGGGSGLDMLETPLRSFGTYAVWFPRGLLLRMAARQALRRTIDGWLVEGREHITAEAAAQIDAFMQEFTCDPAMQPDALAQRIESACQVNPLDLEATPAQALTGMLSALQEQSLQSVAHEDAVNWSRQALNRVHEWVGTGADGDLDMHEWRKTRLNRALHATAQRIAEEFDRKISEQLFALMEHTGARVATAEKALDLAQRYCLNEAEQQKARIAEQQARTNQAWKQVETAIAECDMNGNGGFRLFGGRSRGRQLRSFMEALSHFARQRLAEEMIGAVRHFFAALHGRLGERGRDLSFCRQRLRHLQEHLESGPVDPEEALATTRTNADFTMSRSPLPSAESFWEMIRQSDTARVLLPDNEQDMERAAIRFLQRLAASQWVELDKSIHERALLPRGGLHKACINSGDLSRMLAEPLLEETAAILSERLPIMDVAQILNSEFGINVEALANGQPVSGELLGHVENYKQRATPLIVGDPAKQTTFLLVPASPAGKALGDASRVVMPDIKSVRVPGQSDLMFCREQSGLKATDLERVLKPCRKAYDEVASSPATSPHSRFDVVDWVPLDP